MDAPARTYEREIARIDAAEASLVTPTLSEFLRRLHSEMLVTLLVLLLRMTAIVRYATVAVTKRLGWGEPDLWRPDRP